MKTLIKNAKILTMDDRYSYYDKGCLEICDGIISYIGENPAHEDSYFNEIIDAKNKLISPGLYNAHTHSGSNLAKGVYDNVFHAIGMWYIHAWISNRTPEEIYSITQLGSLEMLKTGVVGCIDHVPVIGSLNEIAPGITDIDPIAEAFRDAGMRATIAISLTDNEYTDIIPVGREQLSDKIKQDIADCFRPVLPHEQTFALLRRLIDKWHGQAEDRLRIMLAPTSPLRCSVEFLQKIAALADEKGLGIHTHLLESKIQTELSQRKFGMKQVELLEHCNMLNEKLSCAHCIWLSDEEIHMLGRAHASVIHNPGSNFRGSAGISPLISLKQAGCNIALGADGTSSNGCQNMFTISRLAVVGQRFNEHDVLKWITMTDIMTMLTRGGAKAARLDAQAGCLACGQPADLTIYDLDSVWLSPFSDPYNLLAWAENGSSVETVMVNGRIVMEHGKVLSVDEKRVKEHCREIAKDTPVRNKHIFDIIEALTPILRQEHIVQLSKK